MRSFWGKACRVRENKPSTLQSADGDVTMGDGNDDAGDAEDADDELIPGCYELDVDPNLASDVDTI